MELDPAFCPTLVEEQTTLVVYVQYMAIGHTRGVFFLSSKTWCSVVCWLPNLPWD